jgi:protein-disulfide isomerase
VPAWRKALAHPAAGLALSVLAGLTASEVVHLRGPPRQRLEATPVVLQVLGDAGSPRLGAADADVTVVVFTDYQCPICRATTPDLERTLDHDRRVRVIYKDWPVFGDGSRLAARTALAAARQGRYAQVHAALMRAPVPLNADRIRTAVVSAGADWSRIEAELEANGEAFDRQLRRQAWQAWSLGLEGTPAYLVGPFLMKGGVKQAALERAIRAARRRPLSG